MKKTKEKKDRIIRRIPYHKEKNLELANSGINLLKDAWENLPTDVTFEERAIFIEIAEKIVKEYSKFKLLNLEQEDNKKN